MARTKTKKEQKQDLIHFLWCMGIVLFAIVGLFELGFIGVFLFGSFRVLFGQYPHVVFILAIVFSVLLLVQPKLVKKQPKRIWVAGVLALLTFLLIMGFPSDPNLMGQEALNAFFANIRNVYTSRDVHAYGGLVGSALYAAMSFLFAREGTMVFVGVMILTIVALVFTPAKIVRSTVHGFKGLFRFLRKMKPAADDKNEVEDVYDDLVQDHSDVSLPPVDDKKDASLFIDYDDSKDTQLSLDIDDEPEAVIDVQKHTMQESASYDNYRLPPKSLLDRPVGSKSNSNQGSAKEKGKRLITVLKQFGIDAELVNIHIGPAVTKFEVKPDSNVKINRISSIQDNIMMELAVKTIRIEAPIPGRSAVGIEIPNIEMVPVRMKDIVLNVPSFYDKDNIWVALGKNLLGGPIAVALNKMPHLLVAGATGSGKSVCMNSIISSILLTKKPDELKLLLIDPKKVEFSAYANIPHLLAPVISDSLQATAALKLIVEEMEGRYETFAKVAVRNISGYNEKIKSQPELASMPWIVVIIDELADLMAVAGKDVEMSIQRITQLARAAGIHLIVATQRPSVDVVTGIIKANIPSRIAFAVSSSTDSRTILDASGAEKLLGYGDMLYVPMGEPNPTRVQGVFVSDQEVAHITEYASKQAKPKYHDAFIALDTGSGSTGFVKTQDDPLYEEAIHFVIQKQKASTSFLQRQYRIGYNRAASLIDAMEQEGIIGPPQGSKPREVRYRTIHEYEENTSN